MRNYLPNLAAFVLLAAGLAGGWWYIDRTYFPKPEPKAPEPIPPTREALQGLSGGVAGNSGPGRNWPSLSRPDLPNTPEPPKPATPAPPVEPAKITPPQPAELVQLGDERFTKQVLLTTQGGAIQQVTLKTFDEANRIGREVKKPDGSIQPLRLIPGVLRPRDKTSLVAEAPFPDLKPGKVPTDVQAVLAEPSYLVLHYPSEDDPRRDAKDARRMNDDHPSLELATRHWTIVEKVQPTDGSEWRVVFETTLGAPYFLKLRKTYTLAAKDYHVSLKFDIEPLPGREKGKGKFRYQIAGPREVPVEGEWYTATYRNALVGWRTPSGGMKRTIEDAATIAYQAGGNKVDASVIGSGSFTYAAVATQYFASAICIDDTAPANSQNPWQYVRPTREPHEWDTPEQAFLTDITVRAVSVPVDPAPGDNYSHRYLIYDGPVKVRLLSQLTGEREVPDEVVNRYLSQLGLKTLTDYHSPNFFGRMANYLYWSDLVITFTNLMHSVLGALHRIGLPWGVAIIVLTVMVRLMLFVPSRKQQAVMARMQEKMAKMKPELDRLQEKYKDNPQMLQQEKTKLMFQHGVNPLSTMSGCLLLFAQMPVFMGLYYCLQESVFFRLQEFLWVTNLSGPDMLLWWTEKIPFLSTAESLGGTLYLGPYLNILPIVSVSLIFMQQKMTMPPPTDEQQEMQQRMMKIMIVVMAVMFYKVAAGLCLYFICSTGWALAERKLIPKPAPPTEPPVPTGGPAPTGSGPKPTNPTTPPAPAQGGGFMSKLKAKIEEMQQQADQQAQRQIRNDGKPGQTGPRKDKKKRK